jgi:FO synthase
MSDLYKPLDDSAALALADVADTAALAHAAARVRDMAHDRLITYSRKAFLPLTHLCRDVCHYCTFAQAPRQVRAPYMSVDDVLKVARTAAQLGCKEALFTLGERPELRYSAARDALAEMGFDTTLAYVAHVAEIVLKETGLLPHINAGTMTAEEMAVLRRVSASMGLMLESMSPRLCEKGGPHYGSPDKDPAVRLATIRQAGELAVPFTSGNASKACWPCAVCMKNSVICRKSSFRTFAPSPAPAWPTIRNPAWMTCAGPLPWPG